MIARRPSILLPLLWLIGLASGQTGTSADSAYDQIRATIGTLSESNCATPLILTVTKQGRPVFGVAITEPQTPLEDKTRIVIVAGQHGNEPYAALAVAQLALRWANDDAFADLRRDAVALIVPVVNPDGLAGGRRFVSSGADPNRDWGRLSLDETRTVAAAIDRWRPHLILDEHEWSQTDGYRFDCVELSGDAPNRALVTLGKRMRAASMPATFSPVDSLPGRDRSLLHRHFLAKGYLTFLIETSPEESVVTKQRHYIQLSAALSRQAVANRDAIEACSASSGEYRLPPQLVAVREPQPAVQKASFGVEAAAAMAAVYCLLLLCGQMRKSGGWSRETRPLAQRSACVPATPHGMLPEITFRSQASRKARRGR